MRTKNEMTPRRQKTKTADEALAALMRLCARAEKSSGDAMRLMRTWNVPEADREKVLQKLIGQRFIDDIRYAEAFVREKTRLSGWGAYKIRAALKGKGIAGATIDAALAAVDPAENAGRLRNQLRRKAGAVKFASPYDLKAKLIRYGLSLGYDYEAVLEAASELTNGQEEECNELF